MATYPLSWKKRITAHLTNEKFVEYTISPEDYEKIANERGIYFFGTEGYDIYYIGRSDTNLHQRIPVSLRERSLKLRNSLRRFGKDESRICIYHAIIEDMLIKNIDEIEKALIRWALKQDFALIQDQETEMEFDCIDSSYTSREDCPMIDRAKPDTVCRRLRFTEWHKFE